MEHCCIQELTKVLASVAFEGSPAEILLIGVQATFR
jgi:hypothetical protein